ncbi:stalk domain-containing protein, partial [Peptococcaceae bacterium]|nr:stalk domain-containing protein [Peptococcaceae bacterium]
MKKLKVLVLVTMLTMMLAVPAIAHQVDVYEEGELVKSVVFKVGAKEYVVNDTERHPMEVAPFIYDGRTFVPVRFLGNALGVPNEQIEWDGATKTATLTRGQYTIALTIGSKTALRNGVEYPMDVSPQLAQGRTQLPARFVAEGLGYNVAWCGERQIVIVYTGDTVPEVTKLPGAIPSITVVFPDVNLNLEVVEPVDPYVVTFLDANLEAAIRDALRKPTGDITKVDMAELTNLRAWERGITDLSGLEYAVNLTSLNLRGNQITDITPLAGLTNLTSLDLGRNLITDITPLAG